MVAMLCSSSDTEVFDAISGALVQLGADSIGSLLVAMRPPKCCGNAALALAAFGGDRVVEELLSALGTECGEQAAKALGDVETSALLKG